MDNEKIIINIPLLCRSKKNSEQIIINPKTHRPMIIQSKIYKEFEKECWKYLEPYQCNIDYPVNLKCTFVVPDKRKRDIVNLLNAIQDILVKYHVLTDDNYNIVQKLNGTEIKYEKGIQKIIIEITKIEGGV